MTAGNGSKSKRLSILSELEQDVIFGMPKIQPSEYHEIFNIDPPFSLDFDRQLTMDSKLFFVLQLGLFRKSLRFFSWDVSEVKDEIRHLLKRYFSEDDYSHGSLMALGAGYFGESECLALQFAFWF